MFKTLDDTFFGSWFWHLILTHDFDASVALKLKTHINSWRCKVLLKSMWLSATQKYNLKTHIQSKQNMWKQDSVKPILISFTMRDKMYLKEASNVLKFLWQSKPKVRRPSLMLMSGPIRAEHRSTELSLVQTQTLEMVSGPGVCSVCSMIIN